MTDDGDKRGRKGLVVVPPAPPDVAEDEGASSADSGVGRSERDVLKGHVEDARLVAAALSGHAPSLNELVQRANKVFWARALRRFGWRGRDRAEEVVQHTWTVLLKEEARQLRAYDPARGASLDTYLGLIARRETSNYLERTRVREYPENGDAVPSPEEVLASTEMAARLHAYFTTKLHPRGRLVWQLVFVDKLTPPEAAKAMNVTLQVVHNWMHTIRKIARQILDGKEPD